MGKPEQCNGLDDGVLGDGAAAGSEEIAIGIGQPHGHT